MGWLENFNSHNLQHLDVYNFCRVHREFMGIYVYFCREMFTFLKMLKLYVVWCTSTVPIFVCGSVSKVTVGVGVLVQPGFIHMCWLGFAFLLCYIHSSLIVLHLFFFNTYLLFSMHRCWGALLVEWGCMVLTLFCTNYGKFW